MRQPKTLTNPTHLVVDRAGKTLVSIKHTRNTVTMRLEVALAGEPAGSIAAGWGPSGADGVMMGRFVGYLGFLFGFDVATALPEGARLIEFGAKEIAARAASTFRFRGEVYSTLIKGATMGLFRATGAEHWPTNHAELVAAKQAAHDHVQALTEGTFRAGEINQALRRVFLPDAFDLINYLNLFSFPIPEDTADAA